MLPRDPHAKLELREECRFTKVMYFPAAPPLSVEADSTELPPVNAAPNAQHGRRSVSDLYGWARAAHPVEVEARTPKVVT